MKKDLIKILNIPKGLKVEKIREEDEEVIVECETRKKTHACPYCKGKSGGYDKVVSQFRHTSLNGKPVFLKITKLRFQCKKCKRVFTEKIEGIKKQAGTTNFFNQMVQEKSRNQDYSSVARELKISPQQVMYKQDLLSLDKFTVPEEKELHLGLDGKYLNGDEEIHVIGEVATKTFMGVTKGGSKEELVKLLKKHLKGKTVLTVSMDMSKRLKAVATMLFPSAAVIVDKFHVIKYCNSVIDLCRVAAEKSVNKRFEIKRMLLMKKERYEKVKRNPKWELEVKNFEKVLEEHAEIKTLWDLKERVHHFYLSKDIGTAKERLRGLLGFLDAYSSVHPEFKDLKQTLLNWEEGILNHFIYGHTNAFIEGLNNKIETLKRKKHGFRNKERFLKSVLFALFPIILFIPYTNLIFTH